ncbi:MAG: MBL fold metallo-hydrolase, partial [Deltaproteobacteria bacterium]|nr:MBL fold metallo-hydrolase [Deltaproteobacteria bacterium]
MKLVFCGSAGAIQTADNANVSFCIIQRNHSILVDASGNPTQNLLKTGIDPAALDALILTHSHPDHLYALPSLVHNLWLLKRKRPLSILCNQDTKTKAEALIELFSLFTRKAMFPMAWEVLEDGIFHGIPGVKIALFPANHPVPTCGVKISTAASSLVYSADTAPSQRLIKEALGATVLIHEASGGVQNEKDFNEHGHSSVRQAAEAGRASGVKRLFICHIDVRYAASP